MRVALVVTTLDGGAGGSAQRLHTGLRALGVDSRVVVRHHTTNDDSIISLRDPFTVRWMRRIGRVFPGDLEDLPLRLYPKRDTQRLFSSQWLPDALTSTLAAIDPSVVNLRWVGGLMRIETLRKIRRPVVWTLSDMWPVTGGCYIPEDCRRFEDSCGNCPYLRSGRDWDLSRWVWRRKRKAWRGVDLTFVTPSNWLAGNVRSSALLNDRRVEVIPSAVDTESYHPVAREEARRILGLPFDKKIVLFGAWRNHVHKGFHHLTRALESLGRSGWGSNMALVVFGFDRPADMPDIGMESFFLGRFGDALSKSIVYSAADVFAAPSTQDNFANTVLESISCGTPCVAFTIGGMPDILDHEKNGYLARPFDTDDLARGIVWTVQDAERNRALGEDARQKALREFPLARYAERYRRLFEELLDQRAGGHQRMGVS